MIGPTILHVFLPIPRYENNYGIFAYFIIDIVENSPAFEFIKQPHNFTVHRYLKEIEYPDFERSWQQQVKLMDPEYFVYLSMNNYQNHEIY